MSLVSTASSHYINFGSASSLDDLPAISVLIWCYPTTTGAAGDMLCVKGTSGGTNYFVIRRDAVPAELYTHRQRNGTSIATAITNDSPLSGSGFFIFIAVTMDINAAGNVIRIYTGSPTVLAAERTYSSNVNGNGTLTADASGDLVLANNRIFGASVLARYSCFQFWNRALSLGEIIKQQFRPHNDSGCVVFCMPGYTPAASVQADWSGNGNGGTVSGMSLADHWPFMSPFGYDLGWQGNSPLVSSALFSRTLIGVGI